MMMDLRKQALAGIATGAPVATQPVNTEVSPVGLNAVANELHLQFNHPDLEAAILANVDRETDGRFNYKIWENSKNQIFDVNNKQTGGYGIFQLTGRTLEAYKNYLRTKKRQDSLRNQILFMRDDHGPKLPGWKINTLPNAGKSRTYLADWWHRIVEAPGYSDKKSKFYDPNKFAKQTLRHNNFMRYRIKQNNGVWQEIPLNTKPEIGGPTYDKQEIAFRRSSNNQPRPL